MEVPGERAAREALLQAWVEAGHDLGNHTDGHPSLFDTPLDAFQDEVRRGDAVTSRRLATYVGRAGMSWLQRWAITRRVPFESEPLVDPFVEDVAYPGP